MNKENDPKYFTRNLGYGALMVAVAIIGYLVFMIVEAFANW